MKTLQKHMNQWIDYTDLNQMIAQKVKSGEPITQELLVTMFYIWIPPVRLDLHELMIVRPGQSIPETGNYLVLKSKTRITMVIREHKTAKSNGSITSELPAKMAKIIWQWLQDRPYRKYMFTKLDCSNADAKPFTSENNFQRFLSKSFDLLCGRHLSVDVLRHIFVTHDRRHDRSIEDKEYLAQRMGHSVSVADNMYRYSKSIIESRSRSDSESEL
jgi:integrase